MDGLMAAGVLNDPLDQRSQTDKDLDQLRASSGVDADLARLKAEMTDQEPKNAAKDDDKAAT
jgi:phage shock protein A